jgi:hypothetical protein
MIITTSTKGQDNLEVDALQVAQDLGLPYVKRRRYSINKLMENYNIESMILVTTKGIRYVIRDQTEEPFFFHPSSAMFRYKRLIKRGHDPFVESTQLTKGMSLLDCTLGLGSDAIIASYIVGSKGKVDGLESVELLAYMVQSGLKKWDTGIEELNLAMDRISVYNKHHLEFLQSSPTSGYDIVYFDPMFEQTKSDSIGLSPLKKIANYEDLSLRIIKEAKRVARRRVVMKDSSHSSRFTQLGFSTIERKYASHWFGTIELE